MINKTESIIIWDHDDSPPNDKIILLWNGYAEKNSQRSILKFMENNSDAIRSEYLSFISSLGNLSVNGKKIVEHLEVQPGFSIWWMSLLSEKNPHKSKAPINCLRLLTVNHLLREIRPKTVELISSSSKLSEALKGLCNTLSISFKYQEVIVQDKAISLEYLFYKLPYILQGFICFVRHLFLRYSLRKSYDINWFEGNDAVFIFSYFLNIDQNAIRDSHFFTKYWEILPNYLMNAGKKLNWLHHFMCNKVIPNSKTGNRLLKTFNKNSLTQDHHNFLDGFMTFAMMIKIIKSWFLLILSSLSWQRKLEKAIDSHDQGWLWPFLQSDWADSLYGKKAMENIICICLLDRAMLSLPKQDIGLYLCENQGWESAFIHFWKKHGHGDLIAVQHSTVKYWDLSYFDGQEISNQKNFFSKPQPDKMALNGHAAWSTFANAYQPMDKMVKVEALRYMYLDKIKQSLKNTQTLIKIKNKVLILGDIKPITTNKMLILLESISEYLNNNWKLTFKSHPANPVTVSNNLSLDLAFSDEFLEKLLPYYNVVIASCFTSSALESYTIGLPVIITLDESDFNFSPLRGKYDVDFVTSSDNLIRALEKLSVSEKSNNNKITDYFWIDEKIVKWRKLLKLDAHNTPKSKIHS